MIPQTNIGGGPLNKKLIVLTIINDFLNSKEVFFDEYLNPKELSKIKGAAENLKE